jgi:outer membrane protein assembly factor BamB
LRKGGDSLYTASIIAVHASTGELAWYFQTTPSDNFDYDATQPLMQADLTIDGRARKVIMQANKNGFFYALDRATGEFISGAAFANGVSWATGLDPKTGRPMEAPGVAEMQPAVVSPGPSGAHNWDPMAFSPATGLVYLPVKSGTSFLHAPDAKWQYDANRLNLGLGAYDGPLVAKFVAMPPATGELVAWNPAQQKAAWRVKSAVVEGGGVLATAGNLVLEGRSDGILAAYRATDGNKLWSFDAGTGIMAPPVTYLADGTQYVSVMVGWGGSTGQFNALGLGPIKPGYGRLLTFRLDATGTVNPPPYGHKEPPVPAMETKAFPETIRQGGLLFNAQCAPCHGLNAVAGSLPDLRYASAGVHQNFESIVLGGARASLGMPSFAKVFDQKQVQAVQAFILTQAKQAAKK